MSRLLICATRKSSGKTLITMGLIHALRERGLSVQPYKKGPDYIDPMWLSRAADRPCINLDFNGMSHDEILDRFAEYSSGTSLAIIEGNMGLYDGLDLEGSDNNAAMAMLLKCPVVLVVDCEGMTRSIAPLLLGYQDFEPNIYIAGVVLNNVAGNRHEGRLRAAVERYTDIAVLGAVQRNADLRIPERHMGLVTDRESDAPDLVLNQIADIVAGQLDIDKICDIVAGVAPLDQVSEGRGEAKSADVTIGIARDPAFCFYYTDDLRAFEREGATLVEFDTLTDDAPPDVDGIFIGGGFPETHGAQLKANAPMRTALKQFVEDDRPVYAECGGLMYFSRSLSWNDQTWDMVGSLPVDVEMQDRPMGRGYVVLEATADHPWPPPDSPSGGAKVCAHEFHYSRISGPHDDTKYAWKMHRGHGVDGSHDGFVYRNLVAGYVHQRHTRSNPWVREFVDFVRRCKRQRQQEGSAQEIDR